VHLLELAERLHARLRERRLGAEGQVAGAMAPLLAAAAGALRTDELLRVVARRLTHALDLARVDVLLVHAGAGYARRVGTVAGEQVAEARLNLGAWGGVAEAAAAEGPVLVTPPVRASVRPADEAPRALALRVPRGPADEALFLLVPRAGRELSPAQVTFAQEVVAGLAPALATPATGLFAPRADPLTGLDLGRAFERRVLVELERSRRYSLGFAIVMLDVDGLARFNEARGTDEGDELLRRLAELLAREVRLADSVARLGGDEFGLLLPETGSDGAETAVRRIRARLEDVKFGVAGSPGVSVGVVTLPYPEVYHPDEALALAEAALLRAKAQGGERIGTL
jgi:diguanylate cyclase (GGDEF)-like protein